MGWLGEGTVGSRNRRLNSETRGGGEVPAELPGVEPINTWTCYGAWEMPQQRE